MFLPDFRPGSVGIWSLPYRRQFLVVVIEGEHCVRLFDCSPRRCWQKNYPTHSDSRRTPRVAIPLPHKYPPAFGYAQGPSTIGEKPDHGENVPTIQWSNAPAYSLYPCLRECTAGAEFTRKRVWQKKHPWPMTADKCDWSERWSARTHMVGEGNSPRR